MSKDINEIITKLKGECWHIGTVFKCVRCGLTDIEPIHKRNIRYSDDENWPTLLNRLSMPRIVRLETSWAVESYYEKEVGGIKNWHDTLHKDLGTAVCLAWIGEVFKVDFPEDLIKEEG